MRRRSSKGYGASVVTGAFARPAKRSEAFCGAVMNNKSKYTGLGITLGAALGAVFGVIAGNMGIWLAIGVVIGVLIGASFRRKEVTCPECAQIHRGHEMRNPGNKLAARS